VRAVADLSVQVLERIYASGRTKPRDVVAAIYDRIGSGRPEWIYQRPRVEALEACAAVEQRRVSGEPLPLYGIPFGVKDNIDVAGMPTTAACEAFAYVPERDARCVEYLLQAGAICLGKTNLDQFATGLSGVRSPYGACSSVGNSLYVSGGSSSGSAVAVALGHVSFALGTDTGGSGRIPAGFNGLVGVKPTVGRLSSRGLVPNCPIIDCPSIFALTVEDGSRILKITDGFDADDPFSRRAIRSISPPPDAGPFRFGVLTVEDREWHGMPECGRLYETAIQRFVEIGGMPVEIDFAPFREAGQMLFNGPWIAERSAALGPIVGDRQDALLDVTRAVLATAQRYDAAKAFAAMHRLAHLRLAVWRQLDSLSALVVPTASRPFTIEEMNADPIRLNNQLGHYSYFANLLDLCAMAIPNGVLSCGVPMGITLLAPAWNDENLAALARRFAADRHKPQRERAAAAG